MTLSIVVILNPSQSDQSAIWLPFETTRLRQDYGSNQTKTKERRFPYKIQVTSSKIYSFTIRNIVARFRLLFARGSAPSPKQRVPRKEACWAGSRAPRISRTSRRPDRATRSENKSQRGLLQMAQNSFLRRDLDTARFVRGGINHGTQSVSEISEPEPMPVASLFQASLASPLLDGTVHGRKRRAPDTLGAYASSRSQVGAALARPASFSVPDVPSRLPSSSQRCSSWKNY